MTADPRRPVLVLCAGLPSSGSTWLFNAVTELLRNNDVTAPPGEVAPAAIIQVAQFYADSMGDFPGWRKCLTTL